MYFFFRFHISSLKCIPLDHTLSPHYTHPSRPSFFVLNSSPSSIDSNISLLSFSLIYDRYIEIVHLILRPGPGPILRHALHSISFLCSHSCSCSCPNHSPCICPCSSSSPILYPRHCPSSPFPSCHCPSPRAIY